MLEAIPTNVRFLHQAVAVTPEVAHRLEALATVFVEQGTTAFSDAVTAWFEQPGVTRAARMVPIDPRLESLRTSLMAALERAPVHLRRPSLARWPVEPDTLVAAELEATVADRALRLMRLVEIDAPPKIIENEAVVLEEALAGLCGHVLPPASGDAVFSFADAVDRCGVFELSLGGMLGTLEALEALSPRAFTRTDLTPGVPLVEWPRLKPWEARGPREAFTVTELRFWKVAGHADPLAEVALEAALAVSQVTAKLRRKANAQLEAEGDGWSPRGQDYVGSLERRLRCIAEDAQAAMKQGLMVLSCVSRTDSV